jgi:hypothetical protein
MTVGMIAQCCEAEMVAGNWFAGKLTYGIMPASMFLLASHIIASLSASSTAVLAAPDTAAAAAQPHRL